MRLLIESEHMGGEVNKGHREGRLMVSSNNLRNDTLSQHLGILSWDLLYITGVRVQTLTWWLAL